MLDMIMLALRGIVPGAIIGFVLGMIAYWIASSRAHRHPTDRSSDGTGSMAGPVGGASAIISGMAYSAYASHEMSKPGNPETAWLGILTLGFVGIGFVLGSAISAGITYSIAVRRWQGKRGR